MYALPDDFIQILRLEYVTQGTGTLAQTQKIEPITPNQRDLATEISGYPICYYIQKDNIVLVPTPSSIVELHLEYSYNIVDMTLASDEPDAPQQFHAYIPYITARDCLVKDGRPLTGIKDQLNEFETLLKQIAVQRQADTTRMVVETDGYSY